MFAVVDPKKPLKVDGFYIKQPSIKFYGEKPMVPDERGNFRVKTQLREASELFDILYVYS